MPQVLSHHPVYAVKYLQYQIPRVLPAEAVCEAWVQIENGGSTVWRKNSQSVRRVDLLAYVDGVLAGTFSLPSEEVRQEERVKVPFSFRAPSKPGVHTLKLDLVQQNVTLFEDQGVEPMMVEFEVTGSGKDRTGEKTENARRISGLPNYGVVYVDHSIPRSVQAGTRFGARVSIENRGAMIWPSSPADHRSVDLAIFVNDRPAGTEKLPLPVVRLGGRVTVHFAVLAPENPGRYKLKIDLVHQNVTFFEQQGQTPLTLEFEVEQTGSLLTGKLYEKALRTNSWFYAPTRGVASSRDGRGFPVFVSKAKGCHIWDTDGRRYIDYTMGWGCALLGYANERVQRAMMAAMESAAILPFPHPLMVEVSEMLCEDIPCAGMVAFGKNGSDVCSLAVRLARLHTGRPKVLVCGYHGWQDWFAELKGFEESGVPNRPEQLIHQFRFNDYESFKALLQVHRNDLAAVMLEPSGPAESIQGPVQDASRDFLEKIAEDTRRAGALLIFDEIITGFRYLKGSVQKATGVFPDLACFGKALGAGAPVSALVGRSEILSGAMPRTFYGPTYKDETYSLAAAKEALTIYRTEPVVDHVWNFGARLKDEVNELCKSLDLHAAMVGPPFRFTLAFTETDPLRLTQLRTLYQQELLKGGIITYNGVMLPSYAHDLSAFQQTLEVIVKALEVVKRALHEDALDRYIEIPLLVP